MERGNRRAQYLIVSAVCTSAVAVGVSFGWATPVLPKINEVGFPVSKEAISWMVSISSIGFGTGSCVARTTSDKCGRRATILGSSLPIAIGTVLMVVASKAWMLICGRLLWGVGMGMLVAVSTIYIAEISDKEIRGRLSLAHRSMISFGCLIVMAVGGFVSYHTLNYMLLALPVISFAACWWIPETPYYLLKEGKLEVARKTLQMLTGIRDEDVLEEKISDMQSHVQVEMRRSSSIKEFLTGKRYRKAIFIVIGIKIPQIMTGLHAVQNYLGPILTESKSEINIAIAVIIFGAVRFLLGIMSSVLVDKLGRRPLLIGSYAATGVLLFILTVYFGFQEKYGPTSYPYNLTPFIIIIMSIVMSVLGYESVAYLIPAEIFPMNVKSLAIASTSVLGGLANFTSVKTYQQIKDWINLSGVFGTYTLAAFVGAAISYFIAPETKGKSLKEIQILLNGDIYEEEDKLNKVVVNNNEVVETENDESKVKILPSS